MCTRRILAQAIAVLMAGHLIVLGQDFGRNLIPNGDFENGSAGWRFTGPYGRPAGPEAARGATVITTDAHAGKSCLRIDTRGRPSEVNAYSEAFIVKPAAKYALSSFVRLLTPRTHGFKVTIDWLDARGRHIAYANDWRGRALGREWLAHGGEFRSPAQAEKARIILGIAPEAVMLFDEISLRAVGPRLDITALGTSRAICIADQTATLRCVLLNPGGATARNVKIKFGFTDEISTIGRAPERRIEDLDATFGLDGQSRNITVGELKAGEEKTISVRLRPTRRGLYYVRAQFASDNAEPKEKTAPIVVIDEAAKPRIVLSSGRAELRFFTVRHGRTVYEAHAYRAEGHGVVEVAVRSEEGVRVVGALRSLAAATIDDEPGPRLIYAFLQKKGDAVTGTAEDDAYRLAFRFTPKTPGWFSLRCELTATRDFELRSFTFPEFHFGCGWQGEKKDSALFCGLEYLTAEEQSSGTENVVSDLAARYVPHPNKVTVPLMAVAYGGWAAGLAWNPLQKWDGERDRPSAVFASPNRLDQQEDHLMALFAPSVPEHVDENQREAARPYPLKTGQTIVLESDLFVLPVKKNVCDVMPEWYRAHDLPALPDISRDHRAHLAHSIEARLREWSEKRKQWKAEAHRGYAFHPDVALHLLTYGINNQGDLADRALAQATAAIERAIASQGPGRLGLRLSLHVGHVKENLVGLTAGARAMKRQRKDGSWPFTPDDRTRTLGEPGDTALGICCDPILRLLKVAMQTGDQRALESALKGLDYVDAHFRRPAGGETWEIPLHAPNLRAAAVAVECGVLAYELTGDQKHLETARYWARSGLPFVYTWRARDREAMRFATISVFGATFYTLTWFGRAVQWVGMVYSRALRRLAPYDPEFPWAHIAEGIVLSCIQQQLMAERPEAHNPWPGAFPDVYSLLDGRVHPAWIGPQSIIESLEDLVGAPTSDMALIGEGNRRIRLLTAAKIENASLERGRLAASLRYAPGRTCYSVLTCISRPTSVLLDDEQIPEVQDLEKTEAGWWVDALHNYLVIKHPARRARIQLAIEGARFAQTDIFAVPARLSNPGFEGGMSGWRGQGRIIANVAHGGKLCLLIDGEAADAEQQVYSERIAVRPDTEYRLEAWVKISSEKTGYKVTINWLDADGRHVSYDNDWKGNSRSREWSPHGGTFTSPKNAAFMELILGARPGVKMLIDDIMFAVR